MESAVRRSTGKNKDGSEVFDWFEKYVLRSKLDVSIDHLELCSLLSHGGDARDKHITLLMNAGLLTRQLIDPNMYWFSIPSIGPIPDLVTTDRRQELTFVKSNDIIKLDRSKTYPPAWFQKLVYLLMMNWGIVCSLPGQDHRVVLCSLFQVKIRVVLCSLFQVKIRVVLCSLFQVMGVVVLPGLFLVRNRVVRVTDNIYNIHALMRFVLRDNTHDLFLATDMRFGVFRILVVIMRFVLRDMRFGVFHILVVIFGVVLCDLLTAPCIFLFQVMGMRCDLFGARERSCPGHFLDQNPSSLPGH
ncbi:uncharacterized protein [Triticum aestivum]|nr:uncharacterized protein LOC123103182 isoform X2 [Triticum aestivum]XP_044380648.1 uncharacterized protein LOC123103182 isoform X2 [Triticum aestivum]